MKKVGVYVDVYREKGGVYQYSLSFVRALSKTKLPVEWYLFSSSEVLVEEKKKLRKLGWNLIDFEREVQPGMIDKMVKAVAEKFGKVVDSKVVLLSKYGIDLAVFPNANEKCLACQLPYLACVHDLQHRINPQFPEVGSGVRWQRREWFFSRLMKEADWIVAESEVGKKQILKFYQPDPEMISVLPYVVPPYLEEVKIGKKEIQKIIKKYRLPKKFLYYPAQLWPHKNHELIVKGMGLLKQKGIEVELVLVGSKKSEWQVYEKMRKLARGLGVWSQIKVLGYVDDHEIVGMYKLATALVMPTWFGPSNIPPLEAFYLGCPVITSDIEGVRDQVGDAALLVDVADPASMAQAIEVVWKSKSEREKLKTRGKKRIKDWGEGEFAGKLETIMARAIG